MSSSWIVAHDGKRLDELVLIEIMDSDSKFVRGRLDNTVGDRVAKLLNSDESEVNPKIDVLNEVLNGLKKINRDSHAKEKIEELVNQLIRNEEK